MGIIYQEGDILIKKENTLVLGADSMLKKSIKKDMLNKYSIIDNTFQFKTKTVGETVLDYHFNLNYINEIADKKIDELTYEEYYYLAIILKLYDKPDFLVIDNLFGYLNDNQKYNIIKICKKNDIKLLVFDNELYNVFSSFEVIIIHEQKLAAKGKFNNIVLEEKLLKRLGYKLPFYVDLSIQLKLYNLIGNVCYSLEELEENLWK